MTVPRRFGIVRFVGNLLKVLAWIILLLTILAAAGVIYLGDARINEFLTQANPQLANTVPVGGGIMFAIVTLLLGILYFLILYVAGERMLMQLAIEENTRLTAALLLRMHQDSQPEPAGRAGYGYGGSGGFDN